MEIKVHGKHNPVSGPLERFAERKLSRLNRYGAEITTIDVELYEEGRSKRGSHIAEIAVATNGPSFRTKTRAADHRAAIDLALDRLTRQLTDFKDKRSAKPARSKHPAPSPEPQELDLAHLVSEVNSRT